MVNGNLDAPYEGASIEAANIPDALLKAKKWRSSRRRGIWIAAASALSL
jgi:hypothetical protein